MQKLTRLLLVLLFQFSYAQDSKIVVQSAHAGHISFAKIDSKQNLMITYGNYDDKTLRIWDLDTGTLLKTIDFTLSVNNIFIDEANSLIYIGNKDGIKAISSKTFNETKQFPIKYLQNFVFNPVLNVFYIVTGESDDTFQEQTYTFSEYNIETNTATPTASKWPSAGYPYAANMVVGNAMVEFHSNVNKERVYFDPNSKQLGVLQSDHLAFFDNFDLLYIDKIDNTHVKVVRYNANTQQSVWEKLIVVENVSLGLGISSTSIAFTPDKKGLWIAPAQSTLIELNPENGDVKGVIYTKTKKTAVVADNDFVYALERVSDSHMSPGFYNKYKRYTAIPITQYGYPIVNPVDFNSFQNKTDKAFVFGDLEGNIGSFTVNPSATQVFNYQTSYKQDRMLSGAFYPDKNTKDVYVGLYNNEGIKRFTLGSPNSFQHLLLPSTYENAASVSPSAKVAITTQGNSFKVYDLTTKKELYETVLKNVKRAVEIQPVIKPTDPEVAFLINDEIIFDVEYKKRIDYYNYQTKKLLWQKEGAYSNLFFIDNNTKLLTLNVEKNQVEILNASNGKLERSFAVSKVDYSINLAINPSQTRLTFSSYMEDLFVYDIQSGKQISKTSKFKNDFKASQFITDTIYVVLTNGYFVFHDINTHQEVLRLYIFLDGEWLAHTPNGQFEGSQNAWNRVVFTKGKQVIPLDQIFHSFYSPNLVYQVLHNKPIEKPNVDIDKLNKAPIVSMQYTEGQRNLLVEDDVQTITTQTEKGSITLTANAFNDKISEIRLFQNGKRLTKNNRNLTVEDDSPSSNTDTFSVSLVAGENTFTAVAVNSQNTESLPATILVTYNPTKEFPKPQGIQLHLLTIGIDSYKNPKYNLNYAVADASGFQQSVSTGIQGITSKVNTYTIKNEAASKTNIISKIQEIANKANPQDVFIFYYAGHGVMSEETEKDFYLVPYDVTQLYGADDALAQKGISATELKNIASTIPAQKQLYILDACQSAGALSAVSMRGASEEKAIAQLARSTGTHWLTASGSEQFATEFDELGHGVFTYALLEALSGKADSGDNRITVNEIKAYLESRVPEISEQYKGSPQYPSSFGFGQDFPVSIKN